MIDVATGNRAGNAWQPLFLQFDARLSYHAQAVRAANNSFVIHHLVEEKSK
jgi:hypothetical protein